MSIPVVPIYTSSEALLVPFSRSTVQYKAPPGVFFNDVGSNLAVYKHKGRSCVIGQVNSMYRADRLAIKIDDFIGWVMPSKYRFKRHKMNQQECDIYMDRMTGLACFRSCPMNLFAKNIVGYSLGGSVKTLVNDFNLLHYPDNYSHDLPVYVYTLGDDESPKPHRLVRYKNPVNHAAASRVYSTWYAPIMAAEDLVLDADDSGNIKIDGFYDEESPYLDRCLVVYQPSNVGIEFDHGSGVMHILNFRKDAVVTIEEGMIIGYYLFLPKDFHMNRYDHKWTEIKRGHNVTPINEDFAVYDDYAPLLFRALELEDDGTILYTHTGGSKICLYYEAERRGKFVPKYLDIDSLSCWNTPNGRVVVRTIMLPMIYSR